MHLSRQRQGEFFIFGELFLWSLFPVITVLSLSSLPALVSLLLSTFFSLCFFAALIAKRNLWHEIGNKKAYKDILLTTFFIGIVYYLLIFFGLQYTSPGNAAIISLTQVFFSFLFFHVFRREYIPKTHIYGGLLIVCGAIIVLASSFNSFHQGDLLILLANAIAPLGNFYMQKARRHVASETIMFIRSVISTIVIFLLAVGLHNTFSFPAIQSSLVFLLINGVLLLGLSKIFWIEGIHRISVTKALGFASIEPLLTLFFAWLLLQHIPTFYQLFAIVPIIPGVILLSKNHTKPQITPVEN